MPIPEGFALDDKTDAPRIVVPEGFTIDADGGMGANSAPVSFKSPPTDNRQSVMGIASPNDQRAGSTAKTFVNEDIPAVAKTFGAKIGGGMQQSIGGLMRKQGEAEGAAYPSIPTSLAEMEAENVAETDRRKALVQRGMNIGNEGRAVVQAANAEYPIQTRAGKIVDQTAQSIGSNLPGMAATLVTGNPAIGLSMMGLQTFGQTYDESRAAGLDIEKATNNAAIQGGTEVATELMPFVQMAKFLKPGKLSSKMLNYYLAEVPGEHVATAVQNATGKYFGSQDMTDQQRKDAAINYLASNEHGQDQIDTFFTTLLQTAVIGGIAKTASLGSPATQAAPVAPPPPSGPLSRAVSRASAPVQPIGGLIAERRGMAGPAQKSAPVAQDTAYTPVAETMPEVAPLAPEAAPILAPDPVAEVAAPESEPDSVFAGAMAADYLLTGGSGVMLSTEYLLQAYSGLFQKSSAAVEQIRKKYRKEITARGLDDIKNFAASDLYGKMLAEIKGVVSSAHNNNPAINDIFDELAKYPTGMPPKVGQRIGAQIDAIAQETLPANDGVQPAAAKVEAPVVQTLAQDKSPAVVSYLAADKLEGDISKYVGEKRAKEIADEIDQTLVDTDGPARSEFVTATGRGEVFYTEKQKELAKKLAEMESEAAKPDSLINRQMAKKREASNQKIVDEINRTDKADAGELADALEKKNLSPDQIAKLSDVVEGGDRQAILDAMGELVDTTVDKPRLVPSPPTVSPNQGEGVSPKTAKEVSSEPDNAPPVSGKQEVRPVMSESRQLPVVQTESVIQGQPAQPGIKGPVAGEIAPDAPRAILATLAKPKKASDAKIFNLSAKHGKDVVNSLVKAGHISFPGSGMAALTKKGAAHLATLPAPLSKLENTQLAALAKNKKRTPVQEEYYGKLKARSEETALKAEPVAKKESPDPKPPVSPPPPAETAAKPKAAYSVKDQTETPNFLKWFGDSKVVDSDGKPQVVYHGTNANFKKVNFKKGAQGLFWFTSDKESIANGDAGAQGSSRVMELYAKIENPAGWAEYDKFSVDELESRGYDGVILPSKDGSFDGFVFKEPTQIKSATDNKGSFDPNNPDIRFSTSTRENHATLSLSRVQDAFPHQKVTEKDGVYTVTTPSGVTVTVSKVGEIKFDRAAAEEAYGRPILDGEKPVAEFISFPSGTFINLTERGVGEIDHETFHAAFALALTAKQQAAVIARYGNEEKAAAEYQRLKDNGSFEAKKGHLFLQAIYRFFQRLRNMVSPTAYGVMQDIAEGRVWANARQRGEGRKFAAAWHGGPHDFDKFSSDKIGTGEGAQAYGYGLYFAGSKAIAQHYKEVLSKRKFTHNGEEIPTTISDTDHPIAVMAKEFLGTDRYLLPTLNDALADISELSKSAIEERVDNDDWQPTRQVAAKLALHLMENGVAATKEGKLYQVELAPSEDEYLLWDKPLNEQSEKVQDALESAGLWSSDSSDTGYTTYKGLQFQKGGDKAASEYLHSLGIRGIKYLDGSSRYNSGYRVIWGNGKKSTDTFNSREQAQILAELYEEDYGKASIAWEDDPKANHNYVIFNDEDVEITAKYSLKSAYDSMDTAKLKSALTTHPKVQALVGSIFNNGKNVTPWQRTVGTMYHLGAKLAVEGKPEFQRVFEKGNEFLTDVSTLAMNAEALAQGIFPKLGTGKGLFHELNPKNMAQHRADTKAIAEPLYQGTLYGGADPTRGKVFSDTELTRIFKLTPRQIELYREARAATDQSLDDMARSLIAKNAKEAKVEYDRDMTLDDMAAEVTASITERMDDMQAELDSYEAKFEETVKGLEGKELRDAQKAHDRFVRPQETAIDLFKSLVKNVDDISKKTNSLKVHGYFPLMRFGDYKVTMKDKDGKTVFYGMYESTYKMRLMADDLAKDPQNAGMSITAGPISKEAYKLFGGMNLEALQLFAEHLNAEESAPYQEYLKVGMNNRSAMKRLVHRKGTAGFNEDAVRTLANFITSNARHASTQYNLHDMMKLANAIPEDSQGDVKDQAVKLHEYLTKPGEEASKLRAYLFFHYLGGSFASGIVNMTQPIMMTAPAMAQHDTPANVIKYLTKASKMSFTDPAKMGGDIGIALRKAEAAGVTAPQEIYQLTAMASNKLFASNQWVNGGLKAWGGFFSAAEAFNRRITFLATYQMMRDKGKADSAAYTEASKMVTETQGIYSKVNRSNWGRGMVGSTLMTFKQFSVMYLELYNRLPLRQKMIMMGTLMFMAGLQGMPFADDGEDIIDTIGQWAGYNTNSKQWLKEFAEGNLGKPVGSFLLRGVSSVLPLDLQGRMGMQNLIPGTAIFKQSEINKGRDVQEFFGPAGGLVSSLGDALSLLATGQAGRAALAAMPRAAGNLAQGIEMMATGAGHDKYGRKTAEVNAAEAAIKLTGFNPTKIAEEGQVKSANFQAINLVRVRKAEIVNQWAYGIAHKDREEINAALDKLKEWNRKNPEWKITNALPAAQAKAKAMNSTGKQRFIKSLPKEQRRRIVDELG